MTFERLGVELLVLCSVCCLASSITVPAGQPILRKQVLQPMRTVRIHRSGSVPLYRNLRVRNMPVKRVYVPMKAQGHPQRYVSSPPIGYKVGPPPPQYWKQKDFSAYRQPQHPPPFRQHVPHNLNAGPPRKARHPKPKYPSKPSYPKYPSGGPPSDGYQQGAQQYLVTDSYGAPKPSSYKPPGTTYGKPHPLLGSPRPPNKVSSPSVILATKEEPATSYVNVYQGDDAKEDGTPTYGFAHSHSYEKKHKGKVYSDSESLVSNHRPIYKHKSDSMGSGSSQSHSVVVSSDDEDTITGTIGGGKGTIGGSKGTIGGGKGSIGGDKGSFQPPKQTYGFQPYEDTRRGDSAEHYGPSQPAQQYYKKQPDTVLGPHYFEQQQQQQPQQQQQQQQANSAS